MTFAEAFVLMKQGYKMINSDYPDMKTIKLENGVLVYCVDTGFYYKVYVTTKLLSSQNFEVLM